MGLDGQILIYIQEVVRNAFFTPLFTPLTTCCLSGFHHCFSFSMTHFFRSGVEPLYTDRPFFTPLFRGITALGDSGAAWVVLSLVLLIPRKTRKAGVMSLAALVFSFLGSLYAPGLLETICSTTISAAYPHRIPLTAPNSTSVG